MSSSQNVKKRPQVGCGAAVFDDDGKLLLLRRLTEPEEGHWSFPGGKVDVFEGSKTAAERETFEETGLRVQCGYLLGCVDLIDETNGIHWVSPVYRAAIVSGQAVIAEPHKHSELGWFSLKALPVPLSEAVLTIKESGALNT